MVVEQEEEGIMVMEDIIIMAVMEAVMEEDIVNKPYLLHRVILMLFSQVVETVVEMAVEVAAVVTEK